MNIRELENMELYSSLELNILPLRIQDRR
jgi:hypothetical protein